MKHAKKLVLVIPDDMRDAKCTCESGISTVKDIEKTFKEVQREYTNRWKFIDKTAKLLASFGFKPGVNVKGDYNIEHDEYPIDWVVNEAIYLATGYGERGDLSGGIQTGDWTANEKPGKNAIKYLITSDRIQTVKLSKKQLAELRTSFEEAYHAHLHFVAPMSRVYTFIHVKVGHLCALSDKAQDEIYDFLWEFRHADLNKDHTDINGRPIPKKYWYDVEQLLELITRVQAEKKKAA